MFESTTIIQALAQSEGLKKLRSQIDPDAILRTAITLQQIPSPTFDEAQRAAHVKTEFLRYGLHDVRIDDFHNVWGCWPGLDPARPALMVSAHIDTVFSTETDLTIKRDRDRVYGPGLGDNSLGVAALLALLELFSQNNIQPATDIWFVANSREEGLGNLDGIRAVWETLKARLGAAIVIEGMALGHIYHAGIAVRRLHITCQAPGGHSWLHFGKPSAVHGLIDASARILALSAPSHPRTTYNIGMINGGHSINSLAMSANLYLDLRSESADTLAGFEQQVRDAVKAAQSPELDFTIDVVGDRPSGEVSVTHPLVQLATVALKAIDHPPSYKTGSTDANIMLANGLPTITIGISYGGHAHRQDEFIETKPIASGIWQLLLLTLAATDHVHRW